MAIVETCVHYHDPESKMIRMQWKIPLSNNCLAKSSWICRISYVVLKISKLSYWKITSLMVKWLLHSTMQTKKGCNQKMRDCTHLKSLIASRQYAISQSTSCTTASQCFEYWGSSTPTLSCVSDFFFFSKSQFKWNPADSDEVILENKTLLLSWYFKGQTEMVA